MVDSPAPHVPRQDNQSTPEPRLRDDFAMGVAFFSRLPAGEAAGLPPNLSRMAPALPFVSVAIAFVPALVLMGLCWLTAPPLVAATVAVALTIVLTGAMPEDALADAADGLFGGQTVERRLEIMKDSRHGTYGVVAIVLSLVLRVTALGAVAAMNPLAAGALMIAATVIARSGSLWLSVMLPAAREGGASASVGRVSRASFLVGAGFAAVLAFVLVGPFGGVLGVALALAVAAGIASAWVWVCRRLVGGQTGDLIGALHALIEAGVLVILSIMA